MCEELRPDFILMDFFMSPPDRTTRASTEDEELADSESSIDLLRNILQVDGEVTPAVILMSSGNVQGRAQQYRGSFGRKGDCAALRVLGQELDMASGRLPHGGGATRRTS